jgi:glycosyltransferase involved in cell wall biosynthesis
VKPIRVCMVTYSLPPIYSGAGTQALWLAQKLQVRDIAVSILTARHSADLRRQESLMGVSVYRLPVLKIGRLRPLSFSLSMAWYLLWHHRRYDIVHIHGAYWRILPVLFVVKLTRKKSIVKMTQLGTDDPQTIRQRRFGRVLYRTLALADAVVSTSRGLTSSYQRSSLPPEKLVQIPNGVDTDLFYPADDSFRCAVKSRLNLSQSAPLVIFVGRVGYRKGADLLLQAWTTIIEKRPDAWLVLVGPIGESDASLRGRPPIEHRLSEVPQTLPLGYQVDVQDYLRAADIFVLPTRMEGLPNALLEAMATGLSCVASNIGGNVDLIVDGKNGMLFELGNVEQLTDILLQLLCRDAERREFGRQARETVEANYSIDKVAEKYMKLYGRVLENRD